MVMKGLFKKLNTIVDGFFDFLVVKIISPPLDSWLWQKYWWLIILIVVITFFIYINVTGGVGVSYECAEFGECGDADYDSINPNDR